jgi:hypothetical protein
LNTDPVPLIWTLTEPARSVLPPELVVATGV